MDSRTTNNLLQFATSISGSFFLPCAILLSILVGPTGCASTDCSYEETYSPISNRVKKCFLFHHDKCSPHPYRALDGYQSDLDKFVVKHAAKKCAKQSLKAIASSCKEKPSKAFRHGYQQAYIDIALGESGEVPPVPPEEYWAAHYRTPTGYLQSQEWFTGYKLGAEHALADGRYDYSKIATPYSLASLEQSQVGYWEENSNYQDYPTEPDYPTEVDENQNSPTPMSAPPLAPPAPQKTLPPAPDQESKLPAPPVPQHTSPKLIQTVPQKAQPHLRPALPQQQNHKPQPLEAPKPPIRLPLPAPTAKKHQPKTQHSAPPAYINDDPPPNPYSLQSYPYTPLPSSQVQSKQIKSAEQSGPSHRLLRIPNRRVLGNKH